MLRLHASPLAFDLLSAVVFPLFSSVISDRPERRGHLESHRRPRNQHVAAGVLIALTGVFLLSEAWAAALPENSALLAASEKAAAPLSVTIDPLKTSTNRANRRENTSADHSYRGLPDGADAVPQAALPLRVGIVDFVRPNPNEAILDATVQALTRAFGRDNVQIRSYSLASLEAAVKHGEVDVFIASSGFFVRMTPYGVRSLATVASRQYPNPNGNDGTLMLIRQDRSDILELGDLRGKALVTSTPYAFTGLQVPKGEIFLAGYDPDDFFGSIRYLGDDDSMTKAFDLLDEKKVDVAFLRICLYEAWAAKHPEKTDRFRIVHDMTAPGEACKRSSMLYPSWTVGSTTAADPRISRIVTRELVEMPPTGADDLYWGVATDYSRVDVLFRHLRIGPYAYLRNWTLRRFLDEYGVYVAFVLLCVLGLALHSIRATRLVEKRTAELSEALNREQAFQRQAQAANERLTRIEKASAVGQLSSIFAHEMRQPLGAISLYAFGLKKRAAARKLDQSVFSTTLEKLVEQAERANRIVERVRAYAKSEAGKPEPLDIVAATQRAVFDLRATGRAKATIEFNANTQPIVVVIDPLDLELVILNLLKNALDAVKPFGSAGRVRVSVAFDRGDANVSKQVVIRDSVVITVEDNGYPLSEEAFMSLAELRPSTKAEGLGLGLAIIRGILERYAGRLSFARRAEGGLIATVRLPIGAHEKVSSGKAEDEPSASV